MISYISKANAEPKMTAKKIEFLRMSVLDWRLGLKETAQFAWDREDLLVGHAGKWLVGVSIAIDSGRLNLQ
jgi:hypothetical protein